MVDSLGREAMNGVGNRHGELDGVAIGAALLTPDEVQHAFTTDLNRCCFVVEVALYPDKGKALEIAHKVFRKELSPPPWQATFTFL